MVYSSVYITIIIIIIIIYLFILMDKTVVVYLFFYYTSIQVLFETIVSDFSLVFVIWLFLFFELYYMPISASSSLPPTLLWFVSKKITLSQLHHTFPPQINRSGQMLRWTSTKVSHAKAHHWKDDPDKGDLHMNKKLFPFLSVLNY